MVYLKKGNSAIDFLECGSLLSFNNCALTFFNIFMRFDMKHV